MYILAHEKEVIKQIDEKIICKELSSVKENQQGILKHPRASSRSILPPLGWEGMGEGLRGPRRAMLSEGAAQQLPKCSLAGKSQGNKCPEISLLP